VGFRPGVAASGPMVSAQLTTHIDLRSSGTHYGMIQPHDVGVVGGTGLSRYGPISRPVIERDLGGGTLGQNKPVPRLLAPAGTPAAGDCIGSPAVTCADTPAIWPYRMIRQRRSHARRRRRMRTRTGQKLPVGHGVWDSRGQAWRYPRSLSEQVIRGWSQ
jgi:hypothetical protein